MEELAIKEIYAWIKKTGKIIWMITPVSKHKIFCKRIRHGYAITCWRLNNICPGSFAFPVEVKNLNEIYRLLNSADYFEINYSDRKVGAQKINSLRELEILIRGDA